MRGPGRARRGPVGEQLVEQVVVGAGHGRLLFVARVLGGVGVVGVEALAGLAAHLAALDQCVDGSAGRSRG